MKKRRVFLRRSTANQSDADEGGGAQWPIGDQRHVEKEPPLRDTKENVN